MIHRAGALWMCALIGVLCGCMMGTLNSSPPATAAPRTPAVPTAQIFDSSTLPPVTPVQEAEPPRCPRAPRTRLIVNERGRVTENGQTLNIRRAAGTQYEQIGRMPPGAIFYVIDGPRCAGDYAWFYIDYEGQEGWIAEADTEVVYAQPYLGG